MGDSPLESKWRKRLGQHSRATFNHTPGPALKAGECQENSWGQKNKLYTANRRRVVDGNSVNSRFMRICWSVVCGSCASNDDAPRKKPTTVLWVPKSQFPGLGTFGREQRSRGRQVIKRGELGTANPDSHIGQIDGKGETPPGEYDT